MDCWTNIILLHRNCFYFVDHQVLAYLAQLLLLKTPWQGAQTTIYCAVAEELESISGKYFGDCCQKKLVTVAATDEEAAERLWRVSAQMVGLDSTDT